MSCSSLPIQKSSQRRKKSENSVNNNFVEKNLDICASENMNSICQDLSSTSSSFDSISGQRSTSLHPGTNGTNSRISNRSKNSEVSLPANFSDKKSFPHPPSTHSALVSSNYPSKPPVSHSKAAIALGTFHKQLRKALNVHPEKYKRREVSPYSRSLSPQPPDMNHPRSRSIDLSAGRNHLRERETGSLSHEINSTLPIIQLPRQGILNQLPKSIDEADANEDSFLTRDIEDLFTDEEDNIHSFDDIITINVSGMKFQTREKTLIRFPETVLGNAFKRKKFYNPKTGEYFFDRNRSCFESILHIYQSNGQVVRPDAIPIELYFAELRFFQFSEEILEQFWINEGYQKPADPKMPSNKVLRKIWELMEYPDSSLAARIFAFMSIAVIITSIISFCLETIPELKSEDDIDREWNSTFFWVEFSCSIWFSLELILRFVAAPDKVDFIKSFLNILDFVAVAPFFINILMFTGNTASSMSFSVLRIVRLVRVFRIFKLSRHSVGLQVLGKTFKASIQEFCLLIFFLVIALVLFSSGVYFAEQGEPNTKFTSIPASFWFVLATLSTVGYGDLVPTGVYGKIVGGGCALIGVITLALPVPIIVANFKHFYRQECRLAKMYSIAQQDNASNASRKSFDVG